MEYGIEAFKTLGWHYLHNLIFDKGQWLTNWHGMIVLQNAILLYRNFENHCWNVFASYEPPDTGRDFVFPNFTKGTVVMLIYTS